MTSGVERKEAAYNNATWGLTDILVGANVRSVGTWEDIDTTWGIEETIDWVGRKGRVEHTWTVEVIGC